MAGDVYFSPSNSLGAGAGDFSPSSAESSFRELDDVFLQTQTRIWLGEVLQTRLNEQLHISDILASGELLFDVSRVIWNMLLIRHIELTYVKAYKYEPFASRKRSGRYMPYSNVDSFLKICKILGLSGIDLFSPSDVVEKRNTRKVCICIRSLSKKARSMNLNVPDFDIVTYTIAMPTDMVQFRRRSLELSQFRHSNSLSQSLSQDSVENSILKGSVLSLKRYLDSSSEQCYDSEGQFPIDSSYDVSSSIESNSTDSPLVNCSTLSQTSLQLATQNNSRDEHINHPFISPLLEAAEKPEWQCLEETEDSLCSSNKETSLEFDKVNPDISTNASGFENYMGRTVIESYDVEDSVFKASTSVSSQGSNSTPKYFKHRSSYGSSSPVSGLVLNFDLDDQLDSENNESSANMQNQESFVSKNQNKNRSSLQYSPTDFHLWDHKGKCVNNEPNENPPDDVIRKDDDISSLDDVTNTEGQGIIVTNPGVIDPTKIELSAKYSCSQTECFENMGGNNDQESIIPKSNIIPRADIIDKFHGQDDTSLGKVDMQANADLDSENGTNTKKRPLLRSVVKGSAILGVMFLFLRLRKSNTGQSNTESKETRKINTGTLSSSNEHIGISRRNGIYPGEKLKLGS